ncbi:MAG: hypothetical protein MZV64_25195 [Ignavibacteriales bacterium]|nr:hypothetical protein [Ignavibacteriales bacterium]
MARQETAEYWDAHGLGRRSTGKSIRPAPSRAKPFSLLRRSWWFRPGGVPGHGPDHGPRISGWIPAGG